MEYLWINDMNKRGRNEDIFEKDAWHNLLISSTWQDTERSKLDSYYAMKEFKPGIKMNETDVAYKFNKCEEDLKKITEQLLLNQLQSKLHSSIVAKL